ncbi:MAG: hypothetical protein Q8P80_05330 [Candidatus Levybacteria bacterium]|nr:hypothetical protein [Candidatus Levybacteria bacterium]
MAVTFREVILHTTGQFIVEFAKGCSPYSRHLDTDKGLSVDLCQANDKRCSRIGEVYKIGNKPTLPFTRYAPSLPQNTECHQCKLREGEWKVISKIRSAITEKSTL